MPTVMAYHDVKDKGHWLASRSVRILRAPRSHQHPDIRRSGESNPSRVGDGRCRHEAVMAAMETQPAADAMAHDGVLPETL